uniref:Uncharacterized protein n=1 Tax=Aegilops tauschii subsp. strangulata TaxID=200361 RepID=A0A453NU41_AEGTS
MRMGYQITTVEARTWICSCSQREYWMFSKLCHTHVLLLALAWAPVCVNAICICQRIMASLVIGLQGAPPMVKIPHRMMLDIILQTLGLPVAEYRSKM